LRKKTLEKITANPERRYSAKELAEEFGVSETTVKNYVKGVFGYGFAEFQKEMRMKLAAKALSETNDSVGTICGKVGFASQSKFGKAFKAYFGVTPLEYRRQEKMKRGNV